MAKRGRGWLLPLGLGGSVAVLVLGLTLAGALDGFENSLWDLRVRTLAQPSVATKQIDVVLLDQSSLDWAETYQGQTWPWSRELYALIADFFARSGARAVVFDVIFDQPSPNAGEDEVFAEALRANGRAVLAEALERQPQGLVASPPIPELAQAARSLGHVFSSPDIDGVHRSLSPQLRLANGTEVPSLALAAWSLGTGQPLPKTQEDRVLLGYRGPWDTHRVIPARRVLNAELQLREGLTPELDPSEFRDHFVFFGFSAQGLMDLRPSPLDASYPGVLVHATALDNLLAGSSPRELSPAWTAVIVVLWALGSALAVARIRRVLVVGAVLAVAVTAPIAGGWLFYSLGWWTPIVAPVLAAIGAGLGTVLVQYAREGRQKRFIQNAFGQYLSPEVISRLVADPDQLKLGGEKRCLSLFFSDVAGFTSISEGLKDDPQALTALLNDYLSEMTSIIYAYGGTIDKYEGDAIIAFWNAPLDVPDHALRAVRASLACQAQLEAIQPRLQRIAGRPVLARIGLNTGDVVIGNMGSTQRFNYTFLGDAGNLASRLEGINKLFGTRFLASEFTKATAGPSTDLVWREIGRVRVVGKNLPVTVYEPLLAAEAAPRQAVLTAFDKALRDWYVGAFQSALEGFEALKTDEPAQRYAQKTRELLAQPPTDWDGVWEAKEK